MSEKADKSSCVASIVSFAAAVAGVVLCFIYVPHDIGSLFITTIELSALMVGVVFGAISLKTKGGLRDLALAGFIIGIVGLSMILLVILGWYDITFFGISLYVPY